ncbi:MAG: flagellar hook-associated protein FlgK [Oscillospiraceae bacterium]|jgi:flagellar hook-associated protein 1 FlgK|nr:flagellar hook-associated protein FlgK [Oscillospiraceae bacterium]
MGIRPTFFGLEIARTGLVVSQKGLDVTAHNISNVNTPGYTRQRLIQAAYAPYDAITQFRPVDEALVGTGAHALILDQVRSEFLDQQYRNALSPTEYWNAKTQGLQYIEPLFDDSGEGSLYASLQGFLTALNTETTEANDREQRELIQERGKALTDNFNLIYSRLLALQEDQNLAVDTVTRRINTIANNIAELNKTIQSYEVAGQPANDLRDQRNSLLDELSGLADITYDIGADNQLSIQIGGKDLVKHLTVTELKCVETKNPLTGKMDILTPVWTDNDAPLELQFGELKAHLDLQGGANDADDDSSIAYFAKQLDTLARAIAQEVNRVHSGGYTHPAADPNGESKNGVHFFDGAVAVDDDGNGEQDTDVDGNLVWDYSAVNAGNFKLSDEVAGNVYMIASSNEKIVMDESDPNFNANLMTHVGNQENMREIAKLFDLQNITYNGISIGSFEGFLNGITLDVATVLNHSKNTQSTYTTQSADISSQREAISGVSLDEEMTNLIKYQHAYNGAARVITAMDEAINTIINSMGIVGRG